MHFGMLVGSRYESHLGAIWEPAVTLASKSPRSPTRRASAITRAEIPAENDSCYLQSKEQGLERKPAPEENDRSDMLLKASKFPPS